MATVGIIGDTHAPFTHPMYRRFCADTFARFGVDEIVHIGDVVDAHALSFWDHDPDGRSAADEAELAALEVGEWYKQFPTLKVCIGNHDERHYRVAKKAGMPDRYIRPYAEVWRTPKWDWKMQHAVDGVLYEHGTGSSGKDAAFDRAVAQRCSMAIGHVHCYAGVKYHANPFNRIFGLNVGCGIDLRAYAFDYGRAFVVRPILGCGIVVDGEVGMFVPMACGDGERYHRSRATKAQRKRLEKFHEMKETAL